MGLSFDVLGIDAELSYFYGSLCFMEGWGVEVEIFVVALILFAEYIVSCSDDEVGVDEEGSAIEGDSSGCIGVFE